VKERVDLLCSTAACTQEEEEDEETTSPESGDRGSPSSSGGSVVSALPMLTVFSSLGFEAVELELTAPGSAAESEPTPTEDVGEARPERLSASQWTSVRENLRRYCRGVEDTGDFTSGQD